MKIDTSTIEKAVIEQVVENLVSENDLHEKVRSEINLRIDKLFAQYVNEQIENAINDAIKDGFDREYQKVDSFGKKVGDPTSIRAELTSMISGYWNERVDNNGKPSSYGERMTRAEWLMSKIVADDFNGQMKQHVVNAAGHFKDGLRASLHETVNDLVSQVFRVNSLGDRGLKRTGPACIDPEAKAAQ